jgi:transposase-like protein
MIKRQRLSNYQIKKIIYYFCVDLDATKTAQISKFNRNTINSYFMLFREAIELNQILTFKKLGGTIEIDESYFGARRKRGVHDKLKRGRGTSKIPIFGIVQREDSNGKKYVFTQMVTNCKAETLLPVIKKKVDFKATVNADSWKSYDGLVALGYDKLFRVNHGKNEFVLKGEEGAVVTVNGMESFWSFAKRRLAKFNGYMENLSLHLKECEWRWKHSPPSKSQSKADISKCLFDMEKDLWEILKSYRKFLIKLEGLN